MKRKPQKGGNSDTPGHPPSPPLVPTVEGNESSERGDSGSDGCHKTKYTEKPSHWTSYLEAACAVLLVVITAFYTYYANQQASAAIKAATAAKESADSEKQSIEVSQRPWVSLDERIASSLVFRDDGVAYIKLTSTATNHGLTPAINARVDFEIVELPRVKGTPQEEAEKFCDTILPPPKDHPDEWRLILRQTIFPQVPSYTQGFYEFTPHPIGVGKIIAPLVIACVVYQSSFSSAWFRTWKIYEIMTPENNPDRPDSYLVPSVGRDIPQKNLVLMPWNRPDHSN